MVGGGEPFCLKFWVIQPAQTECHNLSDIRPISIIRVGYYTLAGRCACIHRKRLHALRAQRGVASAVINRNNFCIEAVAWSCIIVTRWSGAGWIQALSARPTGFLQCFDTVGLVIWPVKIVPDMTYNVFGGTLNLAQSINFHVV